MSRPMFVLAAWVIVALGCSDSSPPVGSGKGSSGQGVAAAPAVDASTPEGVFRAFETARDGHPESIWRVLPQSYRSDVQGLIGEFAAKMDAPLWDKGAATFGKLVKVIDQKREFILGFPLVAMMTGGADPAALQQQLGGVVKVLASVAESDLKTLERMKKLDVDKFLSTTIGGTVKELVAAAGTVSGGPMAGEKSNPFTGKFTTRVVSTQGDAASVEVTQADGSVEPVAMVKVDGAWLPKEMVDGWAQSMAQAKASLAGLEITAEDKTQALMMLGMVDGLLDQLLAANSQEDFNAAIDGVQEMFGKMGG